MKLAGNTALKQAILAMPVPERDKLLLRLVAKDAILVEQLHFMLLEGPDELNIRVNHAEDKINAALEGGITRPRPALETGRTVMKYLNHFSRVTKNKYHEAALKLKLLTGLPMPEKPRKKDEWAERYASWYLKQCEVLQRKLNTLDEDVLTDFSEEMEVLERNMGLLAEAWG